MDFSSLIAFKHSVSQTDLSGYLKFKLECRPVLNVMDALPNVGGALCSMPQSLADAQYLTAV